MSALQTDRTWLSGGRAIDNLPRVRDRGAGISDRFCKASVTVEVRKIQTSATREACKGESVLRMETSSWVSLDDLGESNRGNRRAVRPLSQKTHYACSLSRSSLSLRLVD